MRFLIAIAFGILQYVILFTPNCVLARKLYSDKMDKGKLSKTSFIYGKKGYNV